MPAPLKRYRSTYGKKYIWRKSQIYFLKANWPKMSNRELAKKLNLALTNVREKCYELGLYRMRMEYWTLEQEGFLRKNYKSIGDMELAEIFNNKFPKIKSWTKHHIEKKRSYLNLKRTREQILRIYQRNLDAGRLNKYHTNRFCQIGWAKDGAIRMWLNQDGKPKPKIKINGHWRFWNRWAWKKKYGRIPKGTMITFKDGNPYHTRISNLEAISRAELTRRNANKSSIGLSDNYIAAVLAHGDKEMRNEMKNYPDIISLKRKELQIRRKLKSHGETHRQ